MKSSSHKKSPLNAVLHPFFIAAYPILFLLAHNISQINPEQALRPLAISISFSFLLTILFGFAAKDFRQGGISVSIILGLFFLYGHVHRGLQEYLPFLSGHAFLLTLWLVLLILGMLLKYKIRDIRKTTEYINIITLILLLQPILTIVFFIFQSNTSQEIKPSSPFENLQSTVKTNAILPDIYYIVLDAYGRSDVVQELFDYDNSEFTSYLSAQGFYIAKQSRSNYIQTALSLSSSLNLNYLENIEGENIQSENREPLARSIQHSELRSFLESYGYKTVAFSTGYAPTTITDADIFIPFQLNTMNDLEGLIVNTSMMSALGEKTQKLFIVPFMCEVQRDGILNIFENLHEIPELPGPKLVFAHIKSPHPPFIFDEKGNAVKYGDCNGLDGTAFEGSRADYIRGYPQQIAYINYLTKEVVATILDESATPPVIIIQGDHGSGMLLDWGSLENTCLYERTAILNAYYIPSLQDGVLYESITPVNSFRVVLNEVFSLGLPLLEDRTYYSTWDNPYQVEDVTEKIENSCDLKE